MNMSEAEIKNVLEVHLSYISRRFDAIEHKLDSISREGCEVGRMNSKTIAEVQQAQKMDAQKAGAMSGGLIGIIVAVVAGLIEYFRKSNGG